MGATAHPTGDWIVQLGRNLVMDLEDSCSKARFLIRDRDAKFTPAFDAVLADAGIEVVLSGIRMPRMNSLMESWIQTCRRELPDRTLIWNERHLLHALREFESQRAPSAPDTGPSRTTACATRAHRRPGSRNQPGHPQTRQAQGRSP
jgi:putative transposase